VAESASSSAAIEFLRESERILARSVRGYTRLAGLIVMSAGASVMVFLRALFPSEPLYLAGFIPLCVGAALFGYAQFLAPMD
jgi:hypothetical protein